MNSPISWVGGKKSLRDLIYQRLPKESGRYIEVFGGGGWVLFGRRPSTVMEVYNDFVMYMGELAVCKMLWDKQGNISALKQVAEKYPPKLKRAIIGFFVFEAEFSLMFAESNAEKNDVYYVTAHIVRAISALSQVLFAVNEEYCLNEKKAVSMIDSFSTHPPRYKDKVNSIFAVAGTEAAVACVQLKQLIDEVKGIL